MFSLLFEYNQYDTHLNKPEYQHEGHELAYSCIADEWKMAKDCYFLVDKK